MHLPSLLLLASAAVFVSAYPTSPEDSMAIQPRAAAGTNSTATGSQKDAVFACDHTHAALLQQIAQMAKLKEANIAIPPYLAGYYSATNSGHQAIGCPAINVRKRQVVALQEPCDVINEQHDRMVVLIERFQKDEISIAPFLAGFLSATVDANKGLGCPAFTASMADDVPTAEKDSTAITS